MNLRYAGFPWPEGSCERRGLGQAERPTPSPIFRDKTIVMTADEESLFENLKAKLLSTRHLML